MLRRYSRFGHVDLGETPTASAVREIAEELGVRLDPAALGPGRR
ncbi:NUDIX domain-containing protein [Nocardia sp. NBC_00881]|nr:NUDIX domain-containing protein [Nocardia sp. NBC_00881]